MPAGVKKAKYTTNKGSTVLLFDKNIPVNVPCVDRQALVARLRVLTAHIQIRSPEKRVRFVDAIRFALDIAEREIAKVKP